jgi:uncharacterized protein YgfB (UPF0149 family)
MIADTFNALALEFVKELSEVFPENVVLTDCVNNFDTIVSDPKKPMDFLVKIAGDKAAAINSKDETLFDTITIPGMEIKEMWNSTSENTKEAIWQYLSTLHMLASTLGNTSGELMSGIEDMAMEFANKMAQGNMDVSTMLNEVMQRVQTLDLSSLEGADIGALTKSLGIDPAQITDMMSGMLGGAGGANKELMGMISGMMGGGGDEQDLLKMLENAKPDMFLPPQKKKKSKSGKKHRKH